MTATSPTLLLGISALWIPLAFLFDGVTVLMLPMLLGSDATTIGLVSFVGLAAGAVLQPVVGWLGDRVRDRYDRRLLAAVATAPALGGLWLLAGSTGLVTVVIGYVVVQAAAASVQASQQALIPEHVPESARGRASGIKAASDVGGSFLAFAILGVLLANGELVPAVVATSAILITATAVMLRAVPRGHSFAAIPGGAGHAPSADPGLPPAFGPLVVSRFLFLLGVYVVGRFLVLLVADRLGIPADRAADEAGGLLAIFTLTTAVCAVGAGWLADRISRRDLSVAGALIAAVGVLALVPVAGLSGLLVGGVVMSAGTAAFVTGNWAETTAIVAAPAAGRLMGLANLGTALAAAAAGLLGPLIDVGGFGPTLTLAAAASATAALPIFLPSHRVSKLRSTT